MLKSICTTLSLFLMASTMFSTVSARELTRDNVKVLRIHPVSNERPDNAASQGMTRVYVDSKAWGTDKACRNDAVDIIASDQHLVSLLMDAWNNRRRIDMTVNSTEKPLGNDVCKLVTMTIGKW